MAGELIGLNIPAFNLSPTAVTERNAQYPGDPFDDDDGDGSYNTYLGMNRAGSNAPAIGLNTGNLSYLTPQVGDENPQQWTLLDQDGAGRTPQDSAHLGGVNAAVVPGGELADPPVPNFTPAVIPLKNILDQHGTPDFTDEPEFVVCDAVAAPGVVCDTVTGAVNRTAVTTAVGDIVWGVTPVA